MGGRIASVGHSDLPEGRFFARLAAHRVRAVVDVRSHPVSHVGHFNKDPLAAACAGHGVAYHHLPGLGGKRAVPYPAHMQTEDWERGYARLAEIGRAADQGGALAAFLCVERDPADCHRRFIAARLEADGWEVLHILHDARQARLW